MASSATRLPADSESSASWPAARHASQSGEANLEGFDEPVVLYVAGMDEVPAGVAVAVRRAERD